MQIEKPSVTQVATFLEENRGGVNDEVFTQRYIAGVIESLRKDKKLYRSFGGFWWPLKRLILATDNVESGELYDTELDNQFSYANDAVTVCAAFLAQESNLASGYTYSNKHVYYTADNEPVELTLEDEEMESQVFGATFNI